MMTTDIRARGRLRGGESGQALVEFAIVAPLIVLVLMFAVWFYELIHIKLKVQEAARYAAFEATAFKLHDYDQGKTANSTLALQAQSSIMVEAMLRYADLDSDPATKIPTNFSIFAASWKPGVLIYLANKPEEVIPGGTIVNFVFQIVGTVVDIITALSYKSANPVALSLIALGKDYGGGMTTRMFGSSEWGFNKNGQMKATVAIIVKNEWFQHGVANSAIGSTLFPQWGVIMTDNYTVLADPWHLDKGDDVYSSGTRPGVSSSSPYWKQVNRMYLANSKARGVAKGWMSAFRALMMAALALSGATASAPDLGESDFLQAAVVARNYKSGGDSSGKATISQDRGSTTSYDTLPVGQKSSTGTGTSSSSSILTEYGKSFRDRGEYYMGCTREMSLGCPSSTLSQDNPFGDYIVRE
jgi:hypothetical protein